MKKIFIFSALACGLISLSAQDTIKIDFQSTYSFVNGWYGVPETSELDSVNLGGGVYILQHSPVLLDNQGYIPNAYPDAASYDLHYATASDSPIIKSIKGLSRNSVYDIEILSSRANIGFSRENNITVNDSSQVINTNDNTTLLTWSNVHPIGDSIHIEVDTINSATRTYINAMQIIEHKLEAIPTGAKGFGKHTRGAYAGSSSPTVLYVNTLVDSVYNSDATHGSFRWAVTQNYPRIILFEKSGYISIDTTLNVYNPYMSIYGQTAPSPGVTLTGDYYLDIRTKNVIIQHLRFRPSYNGTAQRDGLTLLASDSVFIDHCSFSYAEDECLGINVYEGVGVKVATVQNSIFSWPLHFNSGKGVLVGEDSDSISFIKNAFIHCADRSPYPNGQDYTKIEVVNNMAYNPEYWGISMSGGDTAQINVSGCVYKHGNDTEGGIDRAIVRFRSTLNVADSVYLYDNYSAAKTGSSEWDWMFFEDARDSTDFKRETPYLWAETPDWPSSVLADSLNVNSGARHWDRDSVDINALYDMVNSTGNRIDVIGDAYFPELAEKDSVITLPQNPHENSGNGYTNLEIWVASYITEPNPCDTINWVLSANITNETNGQENGAIDLTVSGGAAPYTYLWSNTETTQDISSLSSGTYYVSVTDNNTCGTTGQWDVSNVNAAIMPTPEAQGAIIIYR